MTRRARIQACDRYRSSSNHPPTAGDDGSSAAPAYSVNEDGVLTVAASGRVTANDSAAGPELPSLTFASAIENDGSGCPRSTGKLATRVAERPPDLTVIFTVVRLPIAFGGSVYVTSVMTRSSTTSGASPLTWSAARAIRGPMRPSGAASPPADSCFEVSVNRSPNFPAHSPPKTSAFPVYYRMTLLHHPEWS